jgi:hypothetical protein
MSKTTDPSKVSPVVMLRARITYSETGFPVSLNDVEEVFGRRVNPDVEQGWFWVGASERSAADIRRRGFRAVGSLTTTWIPPEDGTPENEVPLVRSPEWVEMMLAETEAFDGPDAPGAGGYFYADAPEEPAGPLRKVIVFRLVPVAAGA